MLEIAPARGWSDGAQTLEDGRYGAEDFACGGGEMNGAARTRRREVKLAGKSFVSPAREMFSDFDFYVDGRAGSNNQNGRWYIVNKGFYLRQQRERDTAKRGL